eukprot:scaffold212093_cov37-Tisochrysis_lutea.AAC.1
MFKGVCESKDRETREEEEKKFVDLIIKLANTKKEEGREIKPIYPERINQESIKKYSRETLSMTIPAMT